MAKQTNAQLKEQLQKMKVEMAEQRQASTAREKDLIQQVRIARIEESDLYDKLRDSRRRESKLTEQLKEAKKESVEMPLAQPQDKSYQNSEVKEIELKIKKLRAELAESRWKEEMQKKEIDELWQAKTEFQERVDSLENTIAELFAAKSTLEEDLEEERQNNSDVVLPL